MDDVKQRVENIESVNRRIIATLVRLEGKMDDMAERMMTKDDGAVMTAQIAGLAGRIDDMNFKWAVCTDRLDGVDKRLEGMDRRLESLDNRFESLDHRVGNLEKRGS